VRVRYGRLDVLLNSAAVQLHGQDGRAHELPLEVWNQTIGIKLTCLFLCCKHAIPLMLADGGSIINVGSPTGLRGSAPGYDAYSSSKGGVMALTRVLAMDYAAYGIRVNSMVPGATETPLIASLLADRAVADPLLARIPVGRFARPEDYVGLAIILASDESAYMTVATLLAEGGITIREGKSSRVPQARSRARVVQWSTSRPIAHEEPWWRSGCPLRSSAQATSGPT
jgi:NAD(P)-dependent dehydrogenase (short-subunit alcohol dehydrogenase family)